MPVRAAVNSFTQDAMSDFATTEVVRHEIAMAVSAIDTRFGGIDKATEVLSATVNRVPTDLQTGIENLKDLNKEIVSGLSKQIEAVREAAKAMHENDSGAIAKSDVNFKALLDKQETLHTQTKDSLTSRMNALEIRVTSLDVTGSTRKESWNDSRSNTMVMVAIIGLIFSVIVGFVGFNLGHAAPPIIATVRAP